MQAKSGAPPGPGTSISEPEAFLKTLTIVLTGGPYISEYAQIACKIAESALQHYQLNIFLYLDAVHIPKRGQSPTFFANVSEIFANHADEMAITGACPRGAKARHVSFTRLVFFHHIDSPLEQPYIVTIFKPTFYTNISII